MLSRIFRSDTLLFQLKSIPLRRFLKGETLLSPLAPAYFRFLNSLNDTWWFDDPDRTKSIDKYTNDEVRATFRGYHESTSAAYVIYILGLIETVHWQ